MNTFEELCRIASKHEWCWKVYCTTCGHRDFKNAFIRIANGVPLSESERSQSSDYRKVSVIGLTDDQKNTIVGICVEANLSSIAGTCKFPDWLGYLGLVLHDMKTNSDTYNALSVAWAAQLKGMVRPDSMAHDRLSKVSGSPYCALTMEDLEACETNIVRLNHAPGIDTI